MRHPFFIILVTVILFLTPTPGWTGQADVALKADRILVLKKERKMTLYKGDKQLKTYKISLGPEPEGPKIQRGDNKTPEGKYIISGRNPKSKFHLSLRISYPNKADRARARKLGVNPGGDIMIHGLPNGMAWVGKTHLLSDWTAGCIAVTSEEIQEIWKAVPDGTPIEIKP